MGNKKQPVETKKRKKKGRPSLLDLQKRSLRLQKQEEQEQKQSNGNPNPNSISAAHNPYLKYPNRPSTRRNPNPNPIPSPNSGEDDDEEEEEEEEDDCNGKRKEKKLKLVLRIPNGSDLGGSGSDLDADGGGSRKKRKIDAVETVRQNSNAKATDEAHQGDPSDSGPTTPLPDKKLLVFILDRLQKKDTYGVFSEPVDPEELPDYHDIIEHPMDFGTLRKKLDSSAYENLEQFESDVFLLCSNAMRYNSPDTIYFRQARSIQELAKKDFGNLRQESDDNEQEPKTVRRGRPPIKHVMKRIGRPAADRTGPDFSSDATLANARDGIHSSNSARDVLRKASSLDKPSITDAHKGSSQYKSERNEEYSGSPMKGFTLRNWKKFSSIDENRRNTYYQPVQSTCAWESSFLTAFDGQRKMLLPAGPYMEHAYARSMAQFAANLGPIGWEIAAKRIERVLPPGTKFGPGWVGEREAANKFHPPQLSTSPSISSQAKLSHSADMAGGDTPLASCDLPLDNFATPPAVSASPAMSATKPIDSVNINESGRISKHEGEFSQLGGGMCPKSPLQHCQNSLMQHTVNGFNSGYGFTLTPQAAKPHARSPEMAMMHSHVLDMVCRNRDSNSHQVPCTQSDAEEKGRSAARGTNAGNFGTSLQDSSRNPEGHLRRFSLNPKPGSVQPDLNADFHSSGSPVSDVLSDSKQQQPDLALQL